MPSILEVRRHSIRVKPSQHLNQVGVTLARRVGEGIGPFARVISSPKNRAVETAIAMGFAVDLEMDELGELGKGVEDEVDWDAGFAAFARVLSHDGPTRKFATHLARLWTKLIEEIPDGGRLLIVTHGGIVEAGALGCLPASGLASRTVACGCCEGVRLTWDRGRWTEAMFLAVPQPRIPPSVIEP